MIVTGITAPVVDFKFYAGITALVDIEIVDRLNAAVPLAGNTLTWLMYNMGSSLLMTKTVGTGITITDGPAGKCQLKIRGAENAGFGGQYLHKLILTDANGDPHMAFRGSVNFE